MTEVERLYQLQELDDGIALFEQKLKQWADRLQKLHHSLEEIRKSRQETGQTLNTLETRLRQTEGALWDHESRLKETEKRLYSDTIHSEREAQAVQAQVEQLRQKKDQLESEALQVMVEMDEKRTLLDKLSREEDRCIQDYEALAQETTSQEQALRQQVEPLRAARTALVAQISPPRVALYGQMRRAGGKAVVKVVNNRCGGCHLDLPLLARKAVAAGELVRCESCGMILLG